MGNNRPVVDLGTGRTATAHQRGRQSHLRHPRHRARSSAGATNVVGQLGHRRPPTTGATQPGEMGDALPVVEPRHRAHRGRHQRGRRPHLRGPRQRHRQVLGRGRHRPPRLRQHERPRRQPRRRWATPCLPVDLGAGRTALAVSAPAASHTCALLDNHTVKCWGANGGGQLGIGNTTTMGDGPGEMGDQPPRRRPRDRSYGHLRLGRRQLLLRAASTTPPPSAGAAAATPSSGRGARRLSATAPNELGDNLPPIDAGRRTERPRRGGRPARGLCPLDDFSSSAGASTRPAASVRATPSRPAMLRRRWATASPRSIWGPAAR